MGRSMLMNHYPHCLKALQEFMDMTWEPGLVEEQDAQAAKWLKCVPSMSIVACTSWTMGGVRIVTRSISRKKSIQVSCFHPSHPLSQYGGGTNLSQPQQYCTNDAVKVT